MSLSAKDRHYQKAWANVKQPPPKPMFTVETQNPHKFKAGGVVVLSQSSLVIPWEEVFLRRTFANFNCVCLIEHVVAVNIHAGGWILTLSHLFYLNHIPSIQERDRAEALRKQFPKSHLDHLVHPEIRIGYPLDCGGLR